MLRNETMYPDPESFRPERFMESSGDPILDKKRNPKNYVFGFGRRQCPGLNLVDSSVWLLMASMLATLDIGKASDDYGNILEPEIVYENPIFRYVSSSRIFTTMFLLSFVTGYQTHSSAICVPEARRP